MQDFSRHAKCLYGILAADATPSPTNLKYKFWSTRGKAEAGEFMSIFWWLATAKFVEAYSTYNKSDRKAAEKMFNNFVLKFGFPVKTHLNQVKEFETQLFRQLENKLTLQMQKQLERWWKSIFGLNDEEGCNLHQEYA